MLDYPEHRIAFFTFLLPSRGEQERLLRLLLHPRTPPEARDRLDRVGFRAHGEEHHRDRACSVHRSENHGDL